MCGRFSLISSEELIKRIFRLNRAPVQVRFNIAPSQNISVIRNHPSTQDRELVPMRWGLIPSWAKDMKIGNRMINAKSETVFEKPAFRNAIKRRRCLIPADGFFEWKKLKKGKQPYYISLENHEPFAFAGIWESWKSDPQTTIESCTILTTSANELIQPLHERMPVIIPIPDHPIWLDPERQSAEEQMSLFHPFPAEEMTMYPVGDWVNHVGNDIPDCIESVQEKMDDLLLF